MQLGKTQIHNIIPRHHPHDNDDDDDNDKNDDDDDDELPDSSWSTTQVKRELNMTVPHH